MRVRDPVRNGKNSDPGSGMEKSRIRDKHPGSATLAAGYLKPSIAAGLKAAGLEQRALYVVEGKPLEHDVRVGGEEGVGRGGGARRIRDGRVVGVRVRHAAARTHDA
jgi:hypothetical protein